MGWSQPARALQLSLDEALAVGDCTRASALSDQAQTDGARLGVARCLGRSGRPQDALSRLTGLRGGPVDGYARLIEAEIRLDLKDPKGALSALDGVTLIEPASEYLAFLRGRALLDAGDLAGARAVLAPLLTGDLSEAGRVPDPWGADPAEVRWLLAEGAVLRGEAAAALPVWRRIWTHNPTSLRASQAATRLAEAGFPVPDAGSPDGRALIEERVRTLDKLTFYQESLALRDQLGGASDRTLARAAFRAKDYARAAALWGSASDLSVSDAFDLALATSRAGDYAAAAERYRDVMTRWPTSSQGDFASYKLGYLRFDAGELSEAVRLLREHLDRYPRSEHDDEARWFIGWSLLRLGKLPEADRAMAELLSRDGGSSLAPAARYWRARIRELSGDPDGAKAGYEAVLSNYATTGYAWFAADRLGKRYPVRQLPPIPQVPDALRSSAWKVGDALVEAGLDGWGRAELAPVVSAARATSVDSRAAVAALLVRAGDYTGARGLLGDQCGSPTRISNLVAAQSCWPRPQGALLERIADESGLTHMLPYAIMSAESGLKPTVSSPVGARGLMQLMPEVGRVAHEQRFPGRPFNADDLYLPAYNAALGTTELSTLNQRFLTAVTQPKLPLVIAGYNGGADAVERWVRAEPKAADGDWFSENIGYTETRQYVKRVLGYLQTWRLVYGDR